MNTREIKVSKTMRKISHWEFVFKNVAICCKFYCLDIPEN